ncbi:hypothetical protein BC829DRAFT_202018 [Chytridium lagenaria]|nr:hypothetical protein BC829DRAFT_202018 [Chytridium lagenaria]
MEEGGYIQSLRPFCANRNPAVGSRNKDGRVVMLSLFYHVLLVISSSVYGFFCDGRWKVNATYGYVGPYSPPHPLSKHYNQFLIHDLPDAYLLLGTLCNLFLYTFSFILFFVFVFVFLQLAFQSSLWKGFLYLCG